MRGVQIIALGGMALVGGAACGKKEVSGESLASAQMPASVAATLPSTAPTPSASARAAQAREVPLSELFDGAGSDAVEKTTRVKAKYEGQGTTAGVPAGWKADLEQHAGLVEVMSDDHTAEFFVHDYMGGVTDGSVKFWANHEGFAAQAKVTWDETLVEGKYGAEHLAVKIGTGRGEYRKKPAKFFHVRISRAILVAGAVTDDAPATRTAELIDGMKSVRPFKKP